MKHEQFLLYKNISYTIHDNSMGYDFNLYLVDADLFLYLFMLYFERMVFRKDLVCVMFVLFIVSIIVK